MINYKQSQYVQPSSAVIASFLLVAPFAVNADIVRFDDAVVGSSAYGFDGNGDGIPDVVFSTENPEGFNTTGPGPNQLYIEEPGLESTTLLRRDLGVKFVGGATGALSFGFALNSSVSSGDYKVIFDVYDEEDNLLASDFEVGHYSSTSYGLSAFPEGRINVSFPGTAAYGVFRATSESGRFIIDNFEGQFSYSPVSSNDITVYSTFPYDGELTTRGMPGITATFGYAFAGTEISAELLVRDNQTLAEAAASRGFDHFNFVQVVTSFPAGSGCLSDVPFLDPPAGGCINPWIEADFLPFYYDEGAGWIGTKYHIGNANRSVVGYDKNTNGVVEVGVGFNDQPVAVFASESNPMEFFLFPVGVYPDGTYESVVTEGLRWQSTNNFFFGGEVGPSGTARSNAVDDGLDYTVLSGRSAGFSELTQAQLAALESTGFINATFLIAEIDIDPKAINRRSNGKWVSASIKLPDGYSTNDIDISTVVISRIEGNELVTPIPAINKVQFEDQDGDGEEELLVKFSRSALAGMLPDQPNSTITVFCRMKGGASVEGTASVNVVN